MTLQGDSGSLDWWVALHIVFLAKRQDLLQLDARRRVYEQVEKYPGLHLSEIARGTDMEINHAKHHLRYLEKHNLVSSQKEDGYWRFWPRKEGSMGLQESVSVDEKKVLALIRKPIPLHIALLLLNHEEMNHARLREETGTAHGTLHYHLRKMEQDNILKSQKEGRERRYRLVAPEKMLSLLLEHKPPDRLVQGFLEAWEALEI